TASTTYTVTITTAATDLAGNALAGNQGPLPGASNYVWTFTTGAGPDATPPTVTLVNPAEGATTVCTTRAISVTFSEPMDPLTITDTTLTLQVTGPPLGSPLTGTVTYDVASQIATFTPSSTLLSNTNYTATVTTGAKDIAGNALASDYVWTFTTGTTTCLAPVNLGAASTFGIAAHAGVTNTPAIPITHIEGNVILDPLATCNAVAVDTAGGFGLCAGSPPTIVGKVFSSQYDPAGIRSTVIADLNAAFLSITPPAGPPAAGTSSGSPTNLPAGTTLGEPAGSALVQGDNYFVPGLYQSTTSIMITGDILLDAQGDANAVFVFQSSSSTGMAAGAPPPGARSRILLAGGAKASNVWWQVATDATLGLYSEFQGNILAARDITMLTGATSCGRLMAGAWSGVGAGSGAFVFDSNVVSVPGQPFAPPATYSTICQ
ncbi:MAG: ice-binding family protein, partial [Gammaproteobacteria bacterium]